jgi:hypothetical protein
VAGNDKVYFLYLKGIFLYIFITKKNITLGLIQELSRKVSNETPAVEVHMGSSAA